jgi:uncharacterized protein YqeY
MTGLKEQLQADLTAAIKSRSEVTSATLRMALAAITTEEVSGKQARELSDADVVAVLGREAKKRREAADAYDSAERLELAQRERDELAVLVTYLPEQLSEAEIHEIVNQAVSQVETSGPAAIGAVMKIVQPQVKGRADGAQVAALVKAALQS